MNSTINDFDDFDTEIIKQIQKDIDDLNENQNKVGKDVVLSKNNSDPVDNCDDRQSEEEPTVCCNYPATISTNLPIIVPFPFPVSIPKNQEEADQRSTILLFFLQVLTIFLKRLFQGGKVVEKNVKRYVYMDWIVFLEGYYDSELRINFSPGGWINQKMNRFGSDPISLYADFCSSLYPYFVISYEIAEKRLFRIAAGLFESVKGKQEGRIYRQVQEKHPPISKFTSHQSFPDFQLGIANYFSIAGELIGVVEFYKSISGEIFRIYHTLWRQEKKHIFSWHQIFPELPYMIYNLHLIAELTQSIIVFVENELIADQLQFNVHQSNPIHTTIPGGLINLLKADLSILIGRIVIICLSPFSAVVQILPDFIEKAKKIGIKEVNFYFNGEELPISTETFLRNPQKYGFEGILNEIKISSDLIVRPPGKIKNYEKKVRKTILGPIKEGCIALLYAAEKTGKTTMALYLANIISHGNRSFGPWKSEEPQKIMYVAGEMYREEIENIISMIMAGQGDNGNVRFFLHLADDQEAGIINILIEQWQKQMEDKLKKEGINMIILDSFFCLTDNKVNDIDLILPWLKKISRQGITVLMIDHTNNDNKLQGSIDKRRAFHLGILMEEVKNDSQENIIKVSIAFSRTSGKKNASYLMRMVHTEDSIKFELVEQSAEPSKPPIPDDIKQLAAIKFLRDHKGMKNKDVANKLGINEKTASQQYKHQINNLSGDRLDLFNQAIDRLVDNEGQSLGSDDTVTEDANHTEYADAQDVKSNTVRKLIDYNPGSERGDAVNKYNAYKHEFINDAKNNGLDGENAWKDLVYRVTNSLTIPKSYISSMPLNMLARLTNEGWDLDGDEGIPPMKEGSA